MQTSQVTFALKTNSVDFCTNFKPKKLSAKKLVGWSNLRYYPLKPLRTVNNSASYSILSNRRFCYSFFSLNLGRSIVEDLSFLL